MLIGYARVSTEDQTRNFELPAVLRRVGEIRFCCQIAVLRPEPRHQIGRNSKTLRSPVISRA